jgi:hypothetical protein
MEAWKFINYSNLSPVLALSITAERWELGPFPCNLVATTKYWQDIESTDNTLWPVWTSPYGCLGSDNDSFLDCDYYDPYDGSSVCDYNDDDGCVISLSASASICAKPQPCGCLILIEGILKNTTGPANSSIVPLSHGITFLFIIALTIATLAMGCISSILEGPTPLPPASQARLNKEVRKYINPPPPSRPHQARVQTYAEKKATATNKALEVAQASELLREMYTLDLAIWGMEESVDDTMSEREEMERKANALFAEIRRRVHAWRSRTDDKWLAEERVIIENICEFVDNYNAERYQLRGDDDDV